MKLKRSDLYTLVIFIFAAYVAGAFYFEPASQVAASTGPVMSDNWFDALTWVKNNTAECSVIATYWDPGHFITGIGRRAVVFDGASQNALFTRQRGNETVTTARIADIATTLYTSSEQEAVDILREYKKPGCDELYYIASADLIGKSYWWTYFATWNPVDKGKGTNYITAQLASARPLVQQNTIVYTYPVGNQQSFVLYEQNGSLTPYLQQGANLLTVHKIAYFTRDGRLAVGTHQGADVEGLIWLEPSRAVMIFAPPEIENSMFTRMFFFNGNDLNNFELVNNWGGEVKLFRVHFPEDEEIILDLTNQEQASQVFSST